MADCPHCGQATQPWPWPEDSREDRYRRIVASYHHGLMQADPVACGKLDGEMAHFQQGWISSTELVGNDELKTAKEFAELYGLNAWNVPAWSRRHPELIPRHKRGGKSLFRVGDVQAYRAKYT